MEDSLVVIVQSHTGNRFIYSTLGNSCRKKQLQQETDLSMTQTNKHYNDHVSMEDSLVVIVQNHTGYRFMYSTLGNSCRKKQLQQETDLSMTQTNKHHDDHVSLHSVIQMSCVWKQVSFYDCYF